MPSPLPGFSSHFGLNNIPFGVASSEQHSSPQCVTRYEDNIIFLADLSNTLDGFDGLPSETLRQPTLNAFAALPRTVHQAVRQTIQGLLGSQNENYSENGPFKGLPSSAVEDISAVTMHLPIDSGDFSDFSCSADHVQNASEAMTGTRSTPPAFYHQPIGYAGRCSSLDVSGTPQARPVGNYWSGKPGASDIVFGQSNRMDYELELGAIVGKPLPRKQRLSAKDAVEHIFGFVLVNDWSGKSTLLPSDSWV